jgi:hypothetical protein
VDEQRVLELELERARTELAGLELELAAVASCAEVRRLQSYVANTEKTTLLLHGIARRMARLEGGPGPLVQGPGERRGKMERLERQLEDAKEITAFVNKRLPLILASLSGHLGPGSSAAFLAVVQRRTALLLAGRELRERIDMEERLARNI